AGDNSRRLPGGQVSPFRARWAHVVWRPRGADCGAVLVVVYLLGKPVVTADPKPCVTGSLARVAWSSRSRRPRHRRPAVTRSRNRCLLLRRHHRVRHRFVDNRPTQRLARRHNHTAQYALLDAAVPTRVSSRSVQSLSRLSLSKTFVRTASLCASVSLWWKDRFTTETQRHRVMPPRTAA